MERARDWRRLFARSAPAPVKAAPEGAAVELLNLGALRSEAARTGAALSLAAGRERARRGLTHAAMLHELARRTGEPDPLLRAASHQARASSEAVGDPILVLEADLAQARAALLAAELFGDPEAVGAARARVEAAGPGAKGVRGLIDAMEALAGGDLDRAIVAADRLDELASTLPPDAVLAVEAALARADLLIGFGLRLRDPALLRRAARDLGQTTAALDPAYLPISWARAEVLRGQALAGEGELAGDAALLAEGCSALAEAHGHIDADHSPLDRARLGHALGMALMALSEASGEPAVAEQGLKVIEHALRILERAPELPVRAVVAHDRASAMARRAVRRRDLNALTEAEGLFRRELRARDARRDPVAWAVTQVALARVYEAQAEFRGDLGERADAALALSAALEVFAERGLKSLAEPATAALHRLKAHA